MIRSRTALLFALACALSLSQPASAQTPPQEPAAQSDNVDPAALAAAQRLLTTMRADATYAQMVNQLIPPMTNAIASARGFNARQQAIVSGIVSDEAHASAGELLALSARSYARYMSAADLDALAAFFETPVGRRYLDAQPQILADTSAVAHVWGQQILAPRVDARLRVALSNGLLQP